MKKLKLDEIYAELTRENSAKNLEPETIHHYERAYREVKAFMEDKHIKCFTKLTQDDWYCLIHWLSESEVNKPKKRNMVTVNTYLKGIRRLVLFSKEKYKCPDIKPILASERLVVRSPYSMEQIEKIIREPFVHSFSKTRGWALSCFLLYAALREKSIINLKIDDIVFDTEDLYVRHLKNRQVVILPLSKTITYVLKKYIEQRRIYLENTKKQDNGFLFIRKDGRSLSRDALYDISKYHNLSRGVKKTGVHIFRNTFIKIMIKNKSDIFTMQKWMTHNDIKSTQRYIDMYKEDLRDSVYQYNPLELLNDKISCRTFQ